MTLESRLRKAADTGFGFKHLRPEQLQAMAALAEGRDVLAVMPTGWGKSAIYQVPALLTEHPCVVVSPLIALQQDQLAALREAAVPAAVAIDSRQRARATKRTWQAIEDGAVGYVFLGPEQFAKDDVLDRLAAVTPSYVAVAEAHCVSAWGHDFRPDYLRLADGLERLGRPPVVALTATASPVVRQEIVDVLGLRDPLIVAGGFDRPNIELEVRHRLDDEARRAGVLDAADGDESGLVYCQTRREAEFYAGELAARGVRAVAYHAGLRSGERDDVHRRFHDGDVSVVAATSAFGMGIDKPDVRFVAHASVPESIDSYYQQIGRAGRDGEPARAVMFYRPEDLARTRRFATHRADEELLARIHQSLDTDTPRRLQDLRDVLGVRGRALVQAVNLLVRSGAVVSGRRGLARTAATTQAAVERARGVAETAERVDLTRVEMMRSYAEGLVGGGRSRCRRQLLLSYFGDHLPDSCGNCDLCRRAAEDGDGSVRPDADVQPAVAPDTVVEHRQWGRGVVLDGDSRRLTVLFDDYGYRTLDLEVVRAGGLLRVC